MVGSVDEPMDYSALSGARELDWYNKSQFDDKEVLEAKAEHFAEVLDHYGVYEVQAKNSSHGKKHVDYRWVIDQRSDMSLRARMVGRDYKWREPGREDVFAAMSQPHNSRVIDFLALKDSDPDDPIVTFELDCVGAYYQTKQDEDIYVDPPEEWLAARRQQGLDDNVTWRLLKQLPGQRAAGNRFLKKVETEFAEIGMEICPAYPNIFRKPGTRVVIDTHMDDWHGCGRLSEAEVVLTQLRERFRLKGTDGFILGSYWHIKRWRSKGPEGTFIRAHPKHIMNVAESLNLLEANPAKTPSETGSKPDIDPELDAKTTTQFRSCVMSLQYCSQDRPDVQGPVRKLTTKMVNPTEWDLKGLKRLTRYLLGTKDYGLLMPSVDQSRYPRGVVELDTHTDTDWAGDKETRKSVACCHHNLDGCCIATTVRQQGFLAMSSAEAELGGIHSGAKDAVGYKRLLEWLGWTVIWRLGTDSSAAKQITARRGVGKLRHMDLKLLWTQQAAQELGLDIYKVPGELNRANLGTKALAENQFTRERRLAGMIHEQEIKLQDAPSVHAVLEDQHGRLGPPLSPRMMTSVARLP